MKNPARVCSLLSLVLALALIAAGCTGTPRGTVNTAPVPEPVTTIATPVQTIPPACGFTTCHGSDIRCGSSVPPICPTEYRTGDRCRKYASCDTSGGSCTLVTGPKYTSCKACADRCQIQSGADPLAAASCEEQC